MTEREGPEVTTTGTSSVATEEPRTRRYVVTENRVAPAHGAEEWSENWADRTRIVLLPTAAPSILGLFGFFAATLLLGSHVAGWWGDPTTPILIFPFVMLLGGLAQFAAGLWAYRARDGLATAMHGIWGAFWLAFGLYQWLVATGNLPPILGVQNVAFGFWFIALAAITLMGAVASLAVSLGFFLVLGPLAAASALAATGYVGGIGWALDISGWLFVISAAAAWYTASAMMLQETFGRTILPTFRYAKEQNVPGDQPQRPMEYAEGMPGSKVGQ